MVSLHGSHKRLQTYQHHYCSVCMTGLFGCRWHRYQQSKVASNKWDIIWFITLIIAFLYVVFMLDYWLVNQNSEDLVAWYLFDKFGRWDPVFDFLLALTGVCLAYVFIVLLMSLCHIGTGHQVYMHWGHRVALALILCGCVTITLFVSSIWSAGWSLMYVSLQISGPFIHVGLMFGMVCMTWLIADWWMQSSSKVRSAVCVGIYVALLSAILVFPPFLESPCVVESSQLPRKPRIIAHRGGAAVAPENTIAAFENAAKHGASTWESDVVISHDGVAFMHHDDTLRRTTNVQSVFPQNAHREACWFNFSQIQQLNSGSWFIQRDPFNTVRGLKDDQRRVYANQSIPTLLQYLELARNNNVRVLFDIKMWDSAKSCRGHPYSSSGLDIVVNAILESKILHHNVLWLYWDTHKVSHNFTRVASAKLGSHMTDPMNLRRHDVSIVNGQFDHLDTQKIRCVCKVFNISVNMYVVDASWLYSLYWCAGVESVTTNQIERLGLLQQPIWLLSPKEFQIMWLATDVIGCAVCLFIWIYQK
ncbi:hypothetical protein CAPTEDRAFT_141663 [Capitella teleta]|uniref:GP-PDE domain-containing protein n=1 Tax=Capitella teleta TaxID=283909 RepID=R7VL98_CAPTE|nr:hypothetical protein CAPTEDRAFT_141663 [Capitella teleta]|eukprot:ELU17435.1 hypothetical protein CAPTEDRAFT_141663 [Capitella teleta]